MVMNKKNIIILSVAVGVVVLAVLLGVLISRGFEDYRAGRLPIYFFNSSSGWLEVEFRELPQTNLYQQAKVVLEYISQGPRGSALMGLWPVGVEIHEFVTDMYVDDQNYVKLWFSDLYENFAPIDEALFRSSITLSMSGLPFVEGVIFHLEDREIHESTKTIANNPFISPAHRRAEDFTFYFVDESGEGLVSVNYHMPDVDLHRRTTRMIERLIEQQAEQEGIMSLIPPETRVRSVLIEPQNPGIYVDLSIEFHRNFSGTPFQAYMMLQSITHTVLANNTANQLFFLIDSERWDDFHGVSDFNLEFMMDETAMLGFVLPDIEDLNGTD